MRDREVQVRPSSHYLHKQTDITSEMRYILIDWLADVTEEYGLSLVRSEVKFIFQNNLEGLSVVFFNEKESLFSGFLL